MNTALQINQTDGLEKYCLSMSMASETVFGKKWLIKELRYKFGNEFTYKGIHIKVVV